MKISEFDKGKKTWKQAYQLDKNTLAKVYAIIEECEKKDFVPSTRAIGNVLLGAIKLEELTEDDSDLPLNSAVTDAILQTVLNPIRGKKLEATYGRKNVLHWRIKK